MRITLRNVKFAAFASRETSCFSATVCMDGEAAFTAANEGSGGADRYSPLRGQSYAECNLQVSYVKAHARTLPPIDLEGMKIPQTIETLISDALTDHLRRRDFDRLMATKVLLLDGGKIYALKVKPRALNAAVLTSIATKYPRATILNRIDRQQAFEHYRASAV